MTNLRLKFKYAMARRRRFVSARTARFELRLDTRHADDVGQMLNLCRRIERGQWEPDFLRTCFDVIQPDETIVEVGTWIGPYSVLLGKYIAPRGRVIGFEPDPVAFRQCVINLALNQVTNVHVLPLAISNSANEISLYTNRIFGNSGSTILESNPTTSGYERGVVRVPGTTLDRAMQALELRPTTLKLDIEGAEDMALEGGHATIGQPGVKLLLEIHHEYLARRGKSANTILRALADAGKEIYFLENGRDYPYRLMQRIDPARPIEVPIFHVLAHA